MHAAVACKERKSVRIHRFPPSWQNPVVSRETGRHDEDPDERALEEPERKVSSHKNIRRRNRIRRLEFGKSGWYFIPYQMKKPGW